MRNSDWLQGRVTPSPGDSNFSTLIAVLAGIERETLGGGAVMRNVDPTDLNQITRPQIRIPGQLISCDQIVRMTAWSSQFGGINGAGR